MGYISVSGKIENHLMLLNMTPFGIDGARIETVLDKIGIYINKNTIPKDKSALIPKGIRLGTPAITTRGLN